jgi:hypothetical protein
MTEQEWVDSTDPVPMLIHLGRRTRKSRKGRLFSVACCRRIWHLMIAPQSQEAVMLSEQYADRLVKKETLGNAAAKAWRAVREMVSSQASPSHAQAADAAWRTAGLNYVWMGSGSARQAVKSRPEEGAIQASLLRCIFGNPFRPVSLAPAWVTPAMLNLAQAAYDNRLLPSGLLDNTRLAVLADALEEGGCDNPDLLSHLRGPGPHVRGCWVLDLVRSVD